MKDAHIDNHTQNTYSNGHNIHTHSKTPRSGNFSSTHEGVQVLLA